VSHDGAYLLVSGLLLAGPQWQRIEAEGLELYRSTEIALRANGRMAAGYNGDVYFAGVQYILDTTFFEVDDSTLDFMSNQASAFAGMRFAL